MVRLSQFFLRMILVEFSAVQGPKYSPMPFRLSQSLLFLTFMFKFHLRLCSSPLLLLVLFVRLGGQAEAGKTALRCCWLSFAVHNVF